MSIGKAYACFGEFINVGGSYFFGSVATYITVTQIVGVDDDDIGPYRLAKCHFGKKNKHAESVNEFV